MKVGLRETLYSLGQALPLVRGEAFSGGIATENRPQESCRAVLFSWTCARPVQVNMQIHSVPDALFCSLPIYLLKWAIAEAAVNNHLPRIIKCLVYKSVWPVGLWPRFRYSVPCRSSYNSFSPPIPGRGSFPQGTRSACKGALQPKCGWSNMERYHTAVLSTLQF